MERRGKNDGRNSLTGEEYFQNCIQSFRNRTFTGLLHASRSITHYFTKVKSDNLSKLNLKYSAKIVDAHVRKVQYLKYQNQCSSVTMLILNHDGIDVPSRPH